MPLNGTKRSQKGEESGNDKKMRAVKSIQISDFVAKPNVGVRVDARDGDNIWAPGSVVGIDKDSVLIHYDGWESTYDESIPWNSNRLAPEFAFTKQVKCLVDLLPKPSGKPTEEQLQSRAPGAKKAFCLYWPCKVQLRMPHPLDQGLAQQYLMTEDKIFIQPYAPHLLPSFDASIFDGGRWVHVKQVHFWMDDPFQLGIMPTNFDKAFEMANKDDSIVGTLPASAFQKKSLLKAVYRVHSLEGAETRNGALTQAVEIPKHEQDESLPADAKMEEASDSENEQEEEMSVESDADESVKGKYTKVPDLWQVVGLEKDKGIEQVAKLLPEESKRFAKQVIHFFLFCYERQMVWERRNRDERITADGYHYTESWAMQEYFFCNNYRELDRGTCYFREHILKLWDMHQKNGHVEDLKWIELVFWASLCYRLVNRIGTFQKYGGIPSIEEWTRFRKFLAKMHAENQKRKDADREAIMTDAHQTSGVPPYLTTMDALVKNNGKMHKELSKKILKCCEGDSDKIVKKCFDNIIKVDGCGPFFSWQVTCDLLECHCLADSTENDWTKLGPGAKDGMKNIFGGSRDAKQNLEDAKLLQTIQDDVYDALGLKFPKWNGVPLTLKNIEHPLCEFSKYISIQNSLRKGCSSWCKRINKTRTAELDFDKACHYVEKCGEKEEILLCDKCLVGFCDACAGARDETSDYWICPRCTAFESQRLAQYGI
jgi:hypothetical protein